MIYVIMGKSATGKDTIFDRLMADAGLGFERLVPYTTRPIRNGEVEGHHYHFVDEAEMNRLDKEGLIVEHRQYNTINGVWHYFTVDDNANIKSKSVRYLMISTLEAYLRLCDYYGTELVVPIYIEVDDRDRLLRAVDRESGQVFPNYEEVCRRYLADEEDFAADKLDDAGIIRRYNNSDLDKCVENITNDIKYTIHYTIHSTPRP